MDGSRSTAWIGCSLLVLLGCRGAQYESKVQSPGAEGRLPSAAEARAPEAPFADAVFNFRRDVQLLGAAPGALDDASARGAVGSLANAIASAPRSQGVDVTDAAVTMRNNYVDVVDATGPMASWRLRDALLVAASVMTRLAKGPYSCEPAMERRVDDFEKAAHAIDPNDEIRAQRHVVVRALAAAGAALASLERASSYAAPPPRTGVAEHAPEVSPRVAPFAAALLRYSDAVDALAVTPPNQVPVVLRRALDNLADVLRVAPGSPWATAYDSLAAIHTYALEMAAAPAHSAAQSSFTLRALDSADLLLTLMATQVSEQTPAIAGEVREMRDQVAAIDAQKTLGPQILTVLGALEAAEDALRTLSVDLER